MKDIEKLTTEEESSLMRKCQKCKDLKFLNEFFWRKKERSLKSSYCKECFSKINKDYKIKNKEKVKEIKKREYKKNKRTYINRIYLLKYNITIEEYEKKLEGQCFVCKICGKTDDSKKGFHIDHCHKTKIVRDILCNHCNRMIGACKENISILNNGIKYLENWSAKA